MKKLIAATIMAATMFTGQQAFASLQDAEEVFTSGKWRVVMSSDMMTDEKSCTGLHIDQGYSVQLNENDFYARVKGAMMLITVRFGDGPATDRVPTSIEKKIRSVDLEGSELQEILNTSRFRMKVLTRVRGFHTLDLDTTGISEAHDYIVNRCGE